MMIMLIALFALLAQVAVATAGYAHQMKNIEKEYRHFVNASIRTGDCTSGNLIVRKEWCWEEL